VANKPGHRTVTGESTKETVKTIAQGRPGISGEPVVTTLVWFFQFPREAAGAHGASGFPCYQRVFSKARAHSASRERGPLFKANCVAKFHVTTIITEARYFACELSISHRSGRDLGPASDLPAQCGAAPFAALAGGAAAQGRRDGPRAALDLGMPGISGLADRMIEAGLIEKRADPNDGRACG
jgi:hypothetical protein